MYKILLHHPHKPNSVLMGIQFVNGEKSFESETEFKKAYSALSRYYNCSSVTDKTVGKKPKAASSLSVESTKQGLGASVKDEQDVAVEPMDHLPHTAKRFMPDFNKADPEAEKPVDVKPEIKKPVVSKSVKTPKTNLDFLDE